MIIGKRFFQNILEERFVLENEPLSRHTTFQTGGPARLLLLPQNEQQLLDCLYLLREYQQDVFVMGRGSNLLAADSGYGGVVLKLGYGGAVVLSGGVISADAGATLTSVALTAAKAGLTGLEFAAGIPGSLGGGIAMNAGAYGGEMKDCVSGIRVLDEGLRPVKLSAAQAGFGYRSSVIGAKKHIVLGATFCLSAGKEADIRQKIEELAVRRRERQPLEFPSAGSTFKRPPEGFAGTLIEQCGLKGFSIGGAQVSPKHAGFIINAGGALSRDIHRLISHVQTVVHERTGVCLEPEVKRLGAFT